MKRLLTGVLLVFCAVAVAEPRSSASEVHVLIDVSGSMKQNDPHNLRLPALRLLLGLLPADSRAGVWLFGSRAAPLLAPGWADEDWKTRARNEAGQIHSRDQHTHIGQALEAALAPWEGKEPGASRAIILLTDGMVDIGKDAEANAAERQRILQALVPRLQKARVSVHAIALSANADHELLEALAARTDGGYVQTDEAERLERLFLRMFEKSTPRDTLPLEDNRFQVDESITELTLLVFRSPDSAATRIQRPDGLLFGRAEASTMAEVRWFREGSHDLVTITDPVAGEWRIDAEMDPDNRAMVVTDLRLQHTTLPNNIFLGERLEMSVFLSEGGERIEREAFLNKVSVSVLEQPAAMQGSRRYLKDLGLLGDREAGDGLFDMVIEQAAAPGAYRLQIRAQSPTFERELLHEIEVAEASLLLPTRELLGQEQGMPYYRISVTPDYSHVAPEGASVTGILVGPGGQEQVVALHKETEPSVYWWLETDPAYAGYEQTLKLQLSGKTAMGRPLHYTAPPLPLPAIITPPAEPEAVVDNAPQTDWLKAGAAALVLNLLAAGGYVLLRWLGRRRRQKKLNELLEGFVHA